MLIPEPIELELDHQHYSARVGPAQRPSPPVLPSPDPEPEVVDLSLEDDALIDTDPLLTPEEVEEIVMEDVESQSPMPSQTPWSPMHRQLTVRFPFTPHVRGNHHDPNPW